METILITGSDDLSNMLKASVEFQKTKNKLVRADAENAMLYNRLEEALNLFEKRFESDPKQFAPGEFEWYTSAAIMLSQMNGRPHIAEKVTEAIYNSTLGE